ncbi:class I SAM-dependent methyltransferase [Sphingobium lactosutens]|uniref:class I SAM-dependent methyltransferase n=1 Tax=Sphingobium lactosutens TaxID=522773 RepID=UPI000C57684C|nr:class I SAM-dependent methyltransferase [Sphingobium lactosutens]MBA36891.1 hypothetical protein [Sphingobium sp.]
MIPLSWLGYRDRIGLCRADRLAEDGLVAEFSKIFDAMRATSMNDWVGGSDPEQVGDACVALFRSLVTLNSESRVLDFGCGIGRGLVSLYKSGIRPSQVVGMDIMPPVIDFCEQHITPQLPNVRFELIEGANDHYDRFIDKRDRESHAALAKKYCDHFTDGYAFSVFTHVTQDDFETLLVFISAMMKPGGRFLLTCFELNAYSRHMVMAGQSMFPLDRQRMANAGDVFIANPEDPLAFIAFDASLIRAMIWRAGMAVTKVKYGCWMGGGIGDGLQDLIVCTKLPAINDAEDVPMTALVRRDPVVNAPSLSSRARKLFERLTS